jgi:hypothetical protein
VATEIKQNRTAGENLSRNRVKQMGNSDLVSQEQDRLNISRPDAKWSFSIENLTRFTLKSQRSPTFLRHLIEN